MNPTIGAALQPIAGKRGSHRYSAALGLPPRSWTKNPTLGGPMGKYTEQFKLTAITAYLDGNNGFRK
ncbi:hypothetical protein, partial [Pseudomonas sp.]|uniref:hypothetical protein n=1 Tax=Pseudomonas sp. TaxID=306 RepID=UPI0031D2C8A4